MSSGSVARARTLRHHAWAAGQRSTRCHSAACRRAAGGSWRRSRRIRRRSSGHTGLLAGVRSRAATRSWSSATSASSVRSCSRAIGAYGFRPPGPKTRCSRERSKPKSKSSPPSASTSSANRGQRRPHRSPRSNRDSVDWWIPVMPWTFDWVSPSRSRRVRVAAPIRRMPRAVRGSRRLAVSLSWSHGMVPIYRLGLHPGATATARRRSATARPALGRASSCGRAAWTSALGRPALTATRRASSCGRVAWRPGSWTGRYRARDSRGRDGPA